MSDAGIEAISLETNISARSWCCFRWWHSAVIVLLVVIACVLLLRWHWSRGFRLRIEAIAAAGYPVTPEELDAWYKWPKSGENAADWIVDAEACFAEPPEADYRRLREFIGYPGEYSMPAPLPEDVKWLLVQHIEANVKALELLHRAATIKESRYPVDLSQGIGGTGMPHFSGVRHACYLLCLQARLRTERADPNGAIQAIEAAFGVAHSLDQEPTSVSQRVRFAGQRYALGAIESLLHQRTPTEAQLDRLEAVISTAYGPHAIVRCLVGAQCVFLDVFERPEFINSDLFTELPPSGLLEPYKGLGLAAREGISFLDTMQELTRVLQLPTYRRQDAMAVAKARFRRYQKRGFLLPDWAWMGDVLTDEIECLASLRTASVALAIERYRLRMGHWPQTLAELIPAYVESVPVGPIDGAPLRYKQLDRGFVVYSVGWDYINDGGCAEPPLKERRPNETYDITFTVQR